MFHTRHPENGIEKPFSRLIILNCWTWLNFKPNIWSHSRGKLAFKIAMNVFFNSYNILPEIIFTYTTPHIEKPKRMKLIKTAKYAEVPIIEEDK